MTTDIRNEKLRINEQSLTSYAYDCYSGAQVSLFLGSIWMDDAVAVSYTLTDPKTPVYGYASKFYGLVAQGNRVVQGQLVVAYTEDGYFTSIMSRLQNEGRNTILTGSSFVPTTATKQIPGGDWQTNQGDKVLERLRKVLTALHEAKEDAQLDPSNVTLRDYVATLEKEKKQLENMTDTQNNTYSRSTIQQRLTNTSGVSLYEDFAEALEDTSLNPTLLDAIAKSNKFQWLIVEGYKGAPKVRRPVEHDLVIKTTTNEKVPYETIGEGFDIIIGYGDLSSGAAEHSIKVLRDVHIISEGQVIEANGNPIFEVYQFFARDIAPLEDLRTDKSTPVSKKDGKTNQDYDKTEQGDPEAGRVLESMAVRCSPLDVSKKPTTYTEVWGASTTAEDKELTKTFTSEEWQTEGWWLTDSLKIGPPAVQAFKNAQDVSRYGSEYGLQVELVANFAGETSPEVKDTWTQTIDATPLLTSMTLVVDWHWSNPADPMTGSLPTQHGDADNGDYTFTYICNLVSADNVTLKNFRNKPQYTTVNPNATVSIFPALYAGYSPGQPINPPGWNLTYLSPEFKTLQQLHTWFKTASLRKAGTSPWTVTLKVTYKDPTTGATTEKVIDQQTGV